MNASPRFHTLPIAEVRVLTSNAVAVRFAIPQALAADYEFIPGQYLTLRDTIDGHDIRRPYSICSAKGENYLEVGIRHVDGGVFSSFAQNLKRGDELQVMTPQGQFKAPLGGVHEYLLIAAGSGITPMLSIAGSVLANEPESRITLVYANQSGSSLMFSREINDLKDRFTQRFSVIHILSRQEQDVELFNGRVDRQKISALMSGGLIAPIFMDGIFLCGPAPMIDVCKNTFRELGVDAEKIHFELFTPAERQPGDVGISIAQNTIASVSPVADGSSVEVVIDGVHKEFNVDGATQTVLQAARSEGIDLPFSCAGGMCCTCRCRVVSGSCEMDLQYSLQDWEIEAGYVLACQSRPTSEKLVLDFDAS